MTTFSPSIHFFSAEGLSVPHKVAIPDNHLVQWSDLYEQQTQTISYVAKRPSSL